MFMRSMLMWLMHNFLEWKSAFLLFEHKNPIFEILMMGFSFQPEGSSFLSIIRLEKANARSL